MDTKGKYLDALRRFRTQSLFIETFDKNLYKEGYEPIFTLTGKDGYPDFKQLFLSYDDPTGYAFATEVLGSYPHLEHLITLKWFNAYWVKWLEELEIKMRSLAIRSIMEVAASEGSKGTTAAKWIADRGWSPKRGRPSKEEIQREKKIHAGISEEITEDAKRLGLH
jgi:hypothetical protein